MKKTANKASRGCVTTFAIFIVATIIFSVQQSYVRLNPLFSFLVAYVLATIVVNKISYRKDQKGAKASIARYLVVGFLMLAGFLYLKNGFLRQRQAVFEEKEEVTTTKVIKEHQKDVNVISHFRKWKDNYGNKFQGNFAVRTADYTSRQQQMKAFRAKNYKLFWHDLYSFMYHKSKNKLDLMYTSFEKIRKKHRLNQRDFAEMVVTFVQDIPYALVLESTCEIQNITQKSLKDVLRRCNSCCIGKIKYGVQQPIAFLGNLKGDCDTRTLLIFTILKQFGYDVAILNSDYYRHSVLGLNIPASGLYKVYKGKKYYLWETTSKYFKLGYLAKNVNNVKHWKMIITSK